MNQSSGRLERLLSEELGECCGEDVDRRLDELSDLESRALTGEFTEDVAVLSALADGTRYRIARLLAAADRELCVCELTPVLSVSQGAISHALSDLREAGLIERRKDGRWRYYRTTPRAAALLAALDAGADGAETGDADAAGVEAIHD
jgi:DNA-binding transcriptional ArsR family regulator